MSDIYVYSRDAESNDYSTMGLVGALCPTKCTFKETLNGESTLELEHPIDEFGRYLNLEKQNVLLAEVPVRTTPEIQNGTIVPIVYKYKVLPKGQITSNNQRTLYSKKSGGSKKKVLDYGLEVTVVQRDTEGEDPDKRWKVKTKYGTGWVYPSCLDQVEGHYRRIEIPNSSKVFEEVESPWTVKPQLFRIYEVKKSIDSISVSARHISYDLLYNTTLYKSATSVKLADCLNGILTKCVTSHGFSAHTNVATENAGINYANQNPINALLDPEEGVCKRFGVDLIRDDFDLYFLYDPGINRGVRIEYGKNMTGVECTISDDEVATRIIPVGETKDGKPLYLVDEPEENMNQIYVDVESVINVSLSFANKAALLAYDTSSLAEDSLGKVAADETYDNDTTYYRWKKEWVYLSQEAQTYTTTVATYQALLDYSTTSLVNGVVFKVTADETYGGATTYYQWHKAWDFVSKGEGSAEWRDEYPFKHTTVLECENCKMKDEEDGKGKVDEKVARARMKQQAQNAFLVDRCYQPKLELSVEFINLGDTEEYSQFKNLEDCFLADYITVRHPDLNIDFTAQITEIEWDCLIDKMDSVTIGSVGKTLANAGITTWQIPSGFSGQKIASETIGTNALSDLVINVRHMQADSVNTNALQARSVVADKIDVDDFFADNAIINHLAANTIEAVRAKIETLRATDISTDSLAAAFGDFLNLESKTVTSESGTFDTLFVNKAFHLVDGNIRGTVLIKNLLVDYAQILNATLDNVVIKGTNGGRETYFRVTATENGLSLSDVGEEITDSEGHLIVNVNGNVETHDVAGLEIDTVATYADLEDYDTESLEFGNIVKVEEDETHEDEVSYYQWIQNPANENQNGSWLYIDKRERKVFNDPVNFQTLGVSGTLNAFNLIASYINAEQIDTKTLFVTNGAFVNALTTSQIFAGTAGDEPGQPGTLNLVAQISEDVRKNFRFNENGLTIVKQNDAGEAVSVWSTNMDNDGFRVINSESIGIDGAGTVFKATENGVVANSFECGEMRVRKSSSGWIWTDADRRSV